MKRKNKMPLKPIIKHWMKHRKKLTNQTLLNQKLPLKLLLQLSKNPKNNRKKLINHTNHIL